MPAKFGKGGVQHHGQNPGGQAANRWRDQAKEMHHFYNPEVPFGPKVRASGQTFASSLVNLTRLLG